MLPSSVEFWNFSKVSRQILVFVFKLSGRYIIIDRLELRTLKYHNSTRTQFYQTHL